MAIEYDSLELNISADVSGASKGIRTLKNNLNALQNTVKGLDFSLLTKLEKHLQNIANIDFSNVSKGLQDVVSAFKAFNDKKFMTEKVKAPTEIEQAKAISLLTRDGQGWEGVDFEEPKLPNIEFDKSLIPQLETTSEVIKEVETDFDNLTVSMSSFYKALREEKGELEGLGSALEGIGLNATQMEKVFSTIGGETGKFTTEQIDAIKTSMEELGYDAKQVEYTIEALGSSLEKLKNYEDFSAFKQSFEGIGLQEGQLKQIFSLFNAEGLSYTEEQLEEIEETLSALKTAEEVADIMAKLRRSIKGAGDEAGKQARTGFQKLVSAFKRILFYRVVRRAIQLVWQALKEGIQNVAMFDSDFNASMSNIISSINYLKNSIGAMVAPLVQIVEPVITMLADGLAEIANSFAEIFNSALGKDTFTSAIKGAEDYAESLKKAKSVSLGIDELNVVSQNDKQNFETKDITNPQEEPSGLVKFMKSLGTMLKEILSSLKDILVPVVELVGAVLDGVLALVEPLLPIISDVVRAVVDIVSPIIQYLTNIIKQVFSFIQPLVSSVLAPMLNAIMAIFKPISSLASGVISKTLSVLEKINDILSPIYNVIFMLYERIGKTFNNVFNNEGSIGDRWADGYQFGDVAGTVFDAGKTAVNWLKDKLGFATGGFPEDGFFFANHNELVGQFSNGKTAVANNEQITEGIYRAVLSAMQDSGANDNSGSREIVVKIDGREIGRASEKYQEQKGANIFSGGKKYGY